MNRVIGDSAPIRTGFFPSVSLFHGSTRLVWAVIGLGVILRLMQYLCDRSLWFDESLLALNIIDRSFTGLLHPLDYDQGAPIGFLMLEKLAIQVLGNSEYTLRLFPLLSGVGSVWLFYGVASRCLTPKAMPIALGLFAISAPLIYYSSEVKQYASDVAIVLALYLATIHMLSNRLTILRAVLFGSVGSLAIWFSHPAVFVLTGIGMSLTLLFLNRSERIKVGQLLIIALLWALSFTLCYFVSLRYLLTHKGLLDYWSDSFMPLPPKSLSDVKLLAFISFEIFKFPVGLALPGIAMLTFVIGGIAIYREHGNKFFLLTLPITVTLLASSLRKYPFGGRLLLFIVPYLLIFIAAGAERIREQTRRHCPLIGMMTLALLFLHPAFHAIYDLFNPSKPEDIKLVLNYLGEHKHDGDVLYLHHGAIPAFHYYAKRTGSVGLPHIAGAALTSNRRSYREDLEKLIGNTRVWLLTSHKSGDDQAFFLHELDGVGTRLEAFQGTGAAVYLYDLSEAAMPLVCRCR